ncbi:MAG TPA: hypothetical protein VHG51_10180 [Longimicrobiaceae bacterium]|nr:hypothetical protein [Longimicrobiaceae bacterium]
MDRSSTLLCLAMLALGATAAACQSDPDPGPGQEARVGVGSPELQAARIRPGVDTLVFLRGTGDAEQPVPGLVLTLRTTLEGDGPGAVVVREEETRGRNGTVVDADSFVLARPSLAPVRQRSAGGQGERTLRFDGRRVQGSRTGPGMQTPVDVALEEPVFYANSLDLVLSALPLREGYAARIPVFDAGSGAVAELRARVAGAETVRTADGGSCQAWRVEVAGGSSNGTYWIERSGRGLVRYNAAQGEMRMLRKSGCGGRAAT